MHFILTFGKGITWESPNIFEKDPGWASEENGTLGDIHEMCIPISKEKAIILQGFEKYNFFVEALQNLNGGGKAKIQSFYFCGAFQGKVLSYQINPVTKQIIKRVSKEGEEYVGSATRGWRKGILGHKPKEGVCSI